MYKRKRDDWLNAMSTSEDSSDGDVAPKGAKGINKPPPKYTSTPVLSPGRLKLYEKRYDENYDLPGDLSYYKWVKENHGKAVDIGSTDEAIDTGDEMPKPPSAKRKLKYK